MPSAETWTGCSRADTGDSAAAWQLPYLLIKQGRAPRSRSLVGVIQPLSQDEVDQAAGVADTPAARLVLVLAAMHAADLKAIRELVLDDVDLGNRRLVIGGRTRPIDGLTHQVLVEWLSHHMARPPGEPS
jgi:hypothetical protein